jgi:ATP-dependent helicase HrpA
MTSISRADIEALHALRSRLTETRLTDRGRIARELDRLFARRERGDFDSTVATLTASIDKSIAKVEALRGLPLKLNYDPELPITAHRDDVLSALAKHQVIVLCGATGSGKTTQLPKFCLEAGRGALGLIGHTQPRRIAARAMATRLASELGTNVGGAVGYQVRFNDRSGPDCRVKLMTDGILLKELESDRNLYRYDTLIIDEAHERSLNIDLLLGVLKRVLEKRHDLKLIVTSATIDPQKFSEFFNGAPIIEVSGRSYPVEVRYRPLEGEDDDATELSLPEGVVAAVKELPRDDVLVFLPGEKQIRECDEALSKAKLHGVEILPLFSRLSARDQERIFEGHSQRRVVLATNVAETSLTVPGIRHVIDSGLARISRYSVRGKVQRLPIEKIAKASADQRKGRCGREAEGICIRLYGEDDFTAREDFTPPEVLRTNLASVILRLAVLGLGEPIEFPFVDPPDTRLINDGYRLLQELKAVDDDRNVTAMGRQIASLPVDPRLARMLIAASHHACLSEMLIVTSFLEIQDPRERPADAQTQADQAHAVFADHRSDFIAILNVWNAFQQKSDELSGNQLRKWCRESFLSFVRMREWQELHRQLKDAVDEIELRANQQPADYANLHQAILTGFLGNIGTLEEKREYLGARGSRFTIAPGTPLASKPPKWVVAGSIMETTRVFARMVANVEPPWIESAGEHLLKRAYNEPQWVEQKGFVGALESVSLYGLTLVGQRRVNYGSVMPKEARQIFVCEALVEGRSSLRAEFLKHNADLRKQVESMEAKIRRRDILVDDQAICDFYLRRLPEQVHSVAAMEKWLRGNAEQLRLSLSDLMRRDAPEITAEHFPDSLDIGGNRLALTYKFEPGQDDDGATLAVPEPLLVTLNAEQLAWAVPGWRLEKLTALLRALPKEQRKHFVPVPDAATRCMQATQDSVSISAAIAAWITRESGVPISCEQLHALPIPEYLQLNVCVTSLDGRFIRQSRNVTTLRREVRSVSAPQSLVDTQQKIFRAWDFGELPEQRVVERRGVTFTVYPAISPKGDGVEIAELGTLSEAEVVSRQGLLRLALLALPQQAKFARQHFLGQRELVLLSQSLKTARPLADEFVERVFIDCFIAHAATLPRSKVQFDALLDSHRARIGEVTTKLAATLVEILQARRTVNALIAKLPATMKGLSDEVSAQLALLMPDDFLHIPEPWLAHLPRYLRALARRIERAPGNAKRDAELARLVVPFVAAHKQLSIIKSGTARPELERLRWMIEEYRVSLFAQDLKTSLPVSDKRLAEQVERAKVEARS